MRIGVVCRILGLLLMLFSLTMLVPAGISIVLRDSAETAFLAGFLVTLLSGALLWGLARNASGDLRTRDGFLITSAFWIVLGLFGAVPFLIAPEPDLSLSEAVFESVSGLTTTGATVITGLDALPRSILFYRQQLQWLGGIGIVVIAVAILPMLGIGGMQLYRAETPGPVKENKLTPRITGTAKALFSIYLALTCACALGFWLAGMSVFDAIAHSFSTVAIGGFSPYDASMGQFDNPLIHLICIVFMVLAALNFALHFVAWRQRSLRYYLGDPEASFFLWMLAIVSVITIAMLWYKGVYQGSANIVQGAFQVVSIATTTGFTTAQFALWPTFLPFLLLMSAFVGGSGGSTAGGIKVIRVLLIAKLGLREFRQLIHPQALLPLKLGKRTVPERTIIAVWSFFAIYVASFTGILLGLLATGLDFLTAFSAVAATLNNLGPGLGDVAAHYGDVSAAGHWMLSFSMLLGRLEIFTLLILLTPAFWRH
jgi:trk system potassium uptake protein